MIQISLSGGYYGLFGVNRGTITDINITGGYRYAGVGDAGILAGSNLGTISYSFATGTFSTDRNQPLGLLVGRNTGTIEYSSSAGSISGNQGESGGLVGFNGGTIAYSNSSAVISGYSGNTVGGLVGANFGGTIEYSYATGAVSGLNSSFAGGLVGQNEGGLIEYSYATGRAYGGYAGGLVGINEPGARNGTIEYSYAIGAAIGSSASGGLVGENLGRAAPKPGAAFGLIEDNYAIGFVNGGSSGGLVGINGGTISASFWVPQTTNQGNAIGSDTNNQSGNVAGLTPAQMTNSAYFTGWSFGGVGSGANWVIVDADGSINNASGAAGAALPMLLSEYSTTITNAHQLQLIALDPTANYTLAANINASGTAGGDVWTSAGFIPLGSQGTAFTGVFNGTGHTISNLTIDLPAQTSVGLFGYSSGTIENVGMALGSITGAGAVGALAGTNAGTISESYSITPVTAVGANGGAGGLAGSNTGTITNSYTMIGAVVSAAGTGGYAGGLVANNAVSGQVTDSYAAGTVSAGGLAGGVIGINAGSSSAVYWDTETTGQRAGFGAQNGSGSAIGYTTAQMQSAVSFSPSVWGTGPDLYPYLLWQYPFGTPQSVSGIAYSDFGITPLVGGQVSVVVVGTPEGSVSTAANGYYYMLLAPGTLSSSTVFTQGPLTYTGTSVLAYETSGGDGARADFMAQSTTGFDIANNMLLIPATATDHSALIAEEFNLEQMALLQTEISPSAVSQAFGNTVDTLSLVETLLVIPNFGFITSGTFTFDEPATITSPLLIQTKTGDIDVEYPVTLTGTGALALNAAGNVNVDQAMTLGGSGSLALVAGNNINFNANVLVQAGGALSFSTGAGYDYSIAPGDSISFTAPEGSGASLTIDGNPYTLVYSMSDLQAINNNLAGDYALAGSLNAATDPTTPASWIPIGTDGAGNIQNSSNGFAGIFEGLGNTISNLTVNTGSANYAGLFGYSTGAIRNVGLIGGSVSGGGYVGGLVGDNVGAISNSYATGAVTGGYDVGGLVGDNDTGTISNSYATGAVNANAYGFAGGLVGANVSASIYNSYATGAVSSNWYAGGLAGENQGSISNSYATGAVSATFGTGGLVGSNYGTINDSYATGAISGGYAGGLVGSNIGAISNSYATGAVSGNGGYTGGLVGVNGGTISASYWDTDNNGTLPGIGTDYNNQLGNVIGLTTAQMANSANFAGWTFGGLGSGATWVIVDTDGTLNNANSIAGGTTPMLVSEYSTGIVNAHQLQLMALDPTANYTLGNNVNASGAAGGDVWVGGQGFVPIGGNNAAAFTGSFNGQGNTISGLTINAPALSNVGLFGINAGTVSNVALTAANITGGSYETGALAGENDGTITNASAAGSLAAPSQWTGGLVGANYSGTLTSDSANVAVTETGFGNAGGLAGENFSTISNSSAAGAVTTTFNQPGSADIVGGLVGQNDGGTISNSYATGAASGTSVLAGGLVGDNVYTGASISNSYATGSVTATGSGSFAGGLVGFNEANATIGNNSYATGAVSNTGGYTGGLVGSNAGTVTNAYATGAVSGGYYVGGLVGSNTGSISNSYGVGAVTGDYFVGGLIGFYSGGTIANSFYDVDTVLINGSHVLTTGALYDAQYQDWIGHNESLNIANYFGSPDANGYYSVSSVQDFQNLLGFAETPGLMFKLAQNIDLSSVPGFYVPYFGGAAFDGQGFTISNLSVNVPTGNVGLFGYVDNATLSNLTLTNVNVTGESDVGGLAGNAAGTIQNVAVNGGTVSGNADAGGLVGDNYADISGSSASATLSGAYAVGGLVGINLGTISSSHATGAVSGSGGYAGGLVGFNGATITDSYATGAVSSTGGYSAVGGLVGFNEGSIGNSYATGAVSGTGGYTRRWAGGLQCSCSTITNSYATGAVS